MLRRALARALGLRQWRLKNGTTFASFSKPLQQLCLCTSPKAVLEFGPGLSTNILLKHSSAKILSFETESSWFQKYRGVFDPARVELVHRRPGWDLGEIRHYGQTFCLVFIDAGDRVAALRHAYDLIDDNGIVFLHDAHREDYEAGIRLYPFVYFIERHSCLLFKSQTEYERVRAAVPADYSCHCQYCSTDARRAYLAQFAPDADS